MNKPIIPDVTVEYTSLTSVGIKVDDGELITIHYDPFDTSTVQVTVWETNASWSDSEAWMGTVRNRRGWEP